MPSTDALAGLREVLSEHPEVLGLSTGSVVQGCSRLIGDEVCICFSLLVGVLRLPSGHYRA